MDDAILPSDLASLRPGDLVQITPTKGYGQIAGKVIAADAWSVVVSAPPLPPHFPNGLIESVPADRIARVTRTGTEPLEQTIVRTYKGKQQADTLRDFNREAPLLAQAGYEPTSQSWAPGQWGAGAFIVALLLCFLLVGIFIFLYLLIVRPEGTQSVTFGRHASGPPTAVDETKVCPRCAETVKAAALVCRYCGHDFSEAPAA